MAFDVWAGFYSTDGNCIGGTAKTVAGTLKDDNYQRIQQAGQVSLDLTMQSRANLKSGEVRVVVRDAASGLTGSVRIPVRNSPKLP